MRGSAPPTPPLRPLALPLLLTSLALATTACPWGRGDLERPPFGAAIQECPMDYATEEHPDSGEFTLPGPITRVPEFHDCQRFIGERGFAFWSWRAYRSLYAIWVRDRLDTVSFPARSGGVVPAQTDSTTTDASGQLVAWIGAAGVPVGGGGVGVEAQAEGVAVALVYAREAGYPALGIKSGFNCLYLYDPAEWKAVMVPVDQQMTCSGNIDPAAAVGTRLEVREITYPDLGNADYPRVTRWDRDPNTREYFIGIKCLAAWCEITSGKNVGTSAQYTGSRTRRVKGWYDEQHLAVRTVAGKQWPTWIVGTAFPDEGLDALLQRGAFPPDTFVTVAHVALRSDVVRAAATDEFAVYRAKFGFDEGSVPEAMSRIEFCYGTATSCRVAVADSCGGPRQGIYWARIVSPRAAGVATEYRCVTYTDHGITMPGVVRWRWLANDEKTWVSCPNGCCQVDW